MKEKEKDDNADDDRLFHERAFQRLD